MREADAIVQRWYDAWRQSPYPHPDVSEAALKDKLPLQLRVIGEQLRQLRTAEDPAEMWKDSQRLDPELRVEQDIPIEEIVQEYRIAVDTIREWIEEYQLDVSFQESSYFYTALFELTAESVRRYAAHEAERVREDRAHYLASVMHQLRTPLSNLSMQVEVLSRMGRNVHRMRNLVDSILRLERFRPEDVPVRPEEVGAAQLVDAVMDDHVLDARRKGLRFEASVDPSLRVTLDPELFTDALGNLVHNAIKFTDRGSVAIDAEPVEDEVVFRVRDSCPGIAPDTKQALFHERLPGGAGGVGIGLQVARHAARAQAGDIELERSSENGCVFALRLPRVVGPREPGCNAPSGPSLAAPRPR